MNLFNPSQEPYADTLKILGTTNSICSVPSFFLVMTVSPDGLLLQSSTVADSAPFQFADGITESVPCSYIEFAERLILPQYKDLPEKEVCNF